MQIFLERFPCATSACTVRIFNIAGILYLGLIRMIDKGFWVQVKSGWSWDPDVKLAGEDKIKDKVNDEKKAELKSFKINLG